MDLTEALTIQTGDKLYYQDREYIATGNLEVDYINSKLNLALLYCKDRNYGPDYGTTYKFNIDELTKEPPKDKIFKQWLSAYLNSYAMALNSLQKRMLEEAYELGYNTKAEEQ